MQTRKYYYYYQRPIRDLSETHRKSTGDRHCLIGDPSETDMPHWTPTCLIGDRHALSETDMPAESNRNFNSFKYSYYYIIFAYLYILE